MTLEILTHPALPPLRHGFFTRKGGASSGLFSGLNCGRRSTDQREMVALNRARAATAVLTAPGAGFLGRHPVGARTAGRRMSNTDNMRVLAVLSTQLLSEQFVTGSRPGAAPPSTMRRIDLTTAEEGS